MCPIARPGFVGPDYRAILTQAVREFMPRAGKHIMFRAWRKIGVYQPGWPPLAESTRRKKRRSLRRMGKRAPWMRFTGGGADQPLIDTGRMANSARHKETANTTCVSMDFPAEVHEQDPLMAVISPGTHTPPTRAFLGPALDESIDPITDQLEDFVQGRL